MKIITKLHENKQNAMTTVTIDGGNITINGMNLEEILERVYNKGKRDDVNESGTEKISFIQLSKELQANGRNISVRTLTAKARDAKVKVFRFDGKRLGVFKNQVKNFIDYPQ